MDSLVRLEGSSSYELRRDVTRFGKRHPNHNFVPLDFRDAKTQARLRSNMQVWQSKKSGVATAENYQRAMEKCLSHANHFELVGVGLLIGDSLEGFSMAEKIAENWMLSHFAVANPDFSGLSGCLLHRLARLGLELGCPHFNYLCPGGQACASSIGGADRVETDRFSGRSSSLPESELWEDLRGAGPLTFSGSARSSVSRSRRRMVWESFAKRKR